MIEIILNMKSIQVTNSTRRAINELYDGSFDDNVKRLIEEVGEYMPFVELDDGRLSSANVKEDTYDLLKSYKLSEGESFENILIRLFLLSQVLNNVD
ncbi:hypothetical protein [Methanobrevibacter sp.]